MLKKILYIIFALIVFSCQEKNELQPDVDVSGIILETSYSVHPGAVVTFACDKSSLPMNGDLLRFVSEDRKTRKEIGVKIDSDSSFSITFPEGLDSGNYILYLIRNKAGYKIGVAKFKVSERPLTPEEMLQAGVTVWGSVTCGGEGVPGVVVSDGVSVTQTDANGGYALKSAKSEGHVFISIPEGYEVPSDKAMAQFYSHLVSEPEKLERVDFTLYAAESAPQSLIVLGDMHLAGINNDVSLFEKSMSDIKAYMQKHPERRYALLTLGDMTWDSYWYSTPYGLMDYVQLMNKIVPSGVQVFNTIGNHDHDQNAVGDILTTIPYRRVLGPTRYSFNYGGAHVMVIDDVECTNSQASTTDDSFRSYRTKVVQDVLKWIAEDLKFVEKDVPVIVAAHCPIYKIASATGFSATMENASELLKCFAGRQTYFLTGHNHTLHNVNKLSGENHYEHNAAAVCAAWWQTQKLAGNNVCADGAPGGYSVFDLDKDGLSWIYKPTGSDIEKQFRVYDLNCVDLDAQKYIPQCTDPESQKLWNSYVQETNSAHTIPFTARQKDNQVLINIWNWDDDWKVTVKENGKSLSVKRIRSYDPLFLVSYVAPRLNKNKSSNINPKGTNHMFLVQASSADSDLEIVVTDRFGNSYMETVERPKTFSIDAYVY